MAPQTRGSSSWARLLRNALLAFASSNLPLTTGQDLYELITTYDGGWKQDGVMFDVQTVRTNSTDAAGTTPDGITVVGMNILTPTTESFCVELYTKAGTFSEGAMDAASWTLLGSFTLVGQGPDTPTEIPLGSFDPVVIGLEETQAFYVTTQNENIRYTALDSAEYVTGDVYASSVSHFIGTSAENAGPGGLPRSTRLLQSTTDGLSVQILTGVAKNYPFAESWPDRVFNGALMYTVGTDSILALSQGQLDEAMSVKRGAVTCDKEAIPLEDMVPTAAPVTPSPTSAPTSGSPTTVESTIYRVATTLRGGVKQAGIMFDVHVPSEADGGPPEGLTVIGFEASTSLLDTSVCFEVYSKVGTYEGYELDAQSNDNGTVTSDTWESIGASTVTGLGPEVPTEIPIGALDPIFIEAGGTRAFYITMLEPEMRYTEPVYGEVTGDVFSGSPDGHIELLVGSAVAYPFQEAWRDRIFNGAVVYALGDIGDNRYNTTASADRIRECPRPTESPTNSPTKAPTDIVDDVTDVAAVNTTTAATTATSITTTTTTTTNPTELSDSTSTSSEEGEYGDVNPNNSTNGTDSTSKSDSGNSGSNSDSDGSTGQDQTVSAARGGEEDASNTDVNANYSKSLSTSGIILVAAFAGVFLLLLVALVVVRARKRPRIKRTDSQELFHEFPEEESHVHEASENYGITATSSSGFSQRFSSRKSPSPAPQPAPAQQLYDNNHHALILNEEDDISLFSSDKSKARFAPGSLRAPDSPGSRGSNRSSRSSSSKKSVEFIRVGQSFGTTRSSQPEDTVDL